jgi:PAS domain S-box-containing protein
MDTETPQESRVTAERYRLLVEQAPDAILLTDQAGRFVEVNSAACAMLGYSRDELLLLRIPDVIAPEDRAQAALQYQSLTPRQGFRAERRMLRKDGTILWTEVRVWMTQGGCPQAIVRDISERVRAAEQLRKSDQLLKASREQLRTVVSNIPVVLAAVDRDGVFTLSEGKGLEALGLKSGEVVGVPIWDLYRDNEENLEAARRVLAGESFVTTIRVGDIVFESHYAPIIGSDGEVEGAIAVGIDITARERAIQAQQEADKYLRTVVANLPVVLGVIDRHGVVTLSEGAGLAQLGLQPGEAVGLPISEVNGVEPDLLESARGALAGETFVTTNTIGETIFESHFAPIIGSNGEVDGAIVVSIDITARERAIQAQQAADRYLHTILNAGPAIFVVIDRDGTIKLSEGPLLSRIGGDPGGAVGVSVWERFADNHEQLAAIRRALSGERTSAELNIAGVDLENHFAPTFAANGDITGVVGIGIDVTERKRAEERFLQAQKMDAIGQLAGGVAHDVNNLMTAIIFNMDLALQEVGTEHAVSADLQDARDIARRAGAMAHQLLAFSRQEIVHPRKLEMNGLVDGVAGMLRRLIGADIELVVRLSLNAGLVRIDATQFEQLLLNLAVNARDAMPGGGMLTIATAPSSAEQDGPRLAGLGAGEYACLSVTDTGEGMSEDVREHIFEPFFTTKGPGSGTGLGLAACYGIVKQAGGAIMVESAPGRGSTFSVYLPHVEADSGATVLDAEPVLTSLPRGTETILLVEDDASVRRGVARILSALGYAVFEAAHAEEALRVSAQHAGDIALLLTDVVMPGMGGEQLAAVLSSERPGLKVLLTSGYAADSPGGGGADARDTKRGRAFLRKPFEPASLAHAVRAALDAPP